MNWDRIERNRMPPSGCYRNSYGIAKDAAAKRTTGFGAKTDSNKWVQ